MSAIHPSIYEVFDHQKTELLLHMLDADPGIYAVMIFLRTRDGVHSLTASLNHAGVSAQSLHGNKKAELRDRALREFGDGKFRVLVMTEAVARSIDLTSAGHMVHFDFPEMNGDCLQRTELVRNAGGESILLVSPQDMVLLGKLEADVGTELPRVKVDDFNYASQPANVKPQRKKGGRSRGLHSKPLQNKKPKFKKKRGR